MAITVICVFVFRLLCRSPPGLGFFSLFSWHNPVPVPPCLNNELWERCWEEKHSMALRPGRQRKLANSGTERVQSSPTRCIHQEYTPCKHQSHGRGCLPGLAGHRAHFYICSAPLSSWCVCFWALSGRRCWDMWASVLPWHGQWCVLRQIWSQLTHFKTSVARLGIKLSHLLTLIPMP